MKHPKTRVLIREIAKDEALTTQDVESIISSHFEFVRHCISEKVDRSTNYFPAIRLHNFGIFFCTEGRKKQMEKLNNRLKKWN